MVRKREAKFLDKFSRQGPMSSLVEGSTTLANIDSYVRETAPVVEIRCSSSRQKTTNLGKRNAKQRSTRSSASKDLVYLTDKALHTPKKKQTILQCSSSKKNRLQATAEQDIEICLELTDQKRTKSTERAERNEQYSQPQLAPGQRDFIQVSSGENEIQESLKPESPPALGTNQLPFEQT